jgi:peptidoglycan/xylan/chitin deacetylase (PgdA/CDA1 family)
LYEPEIDRPVLILAYHRVNPEVRDGLSVSPSTLRQHLTTLLDRGLTNVVLEDVIGADPDSLPQRAFAVTFDDGYRDNLVYAAPVLEDLGLRCTVYLVSSMIDSDIPFPWLKYGERGGFDDLDLHMTTAQIEKGMEDGLFTYGSHTVSHPMLSDLDEDAARLEIRSSKSDLEQRFGIDITTFCYPAGNFNDKTLQLVEEAGYRAAVVTPNRYIPESMHTLHRVGIYSHITPRLFSLKTSRLFDRAQKSKAFWDARARLDRRRRVA